MFEWDSSFARKVPPGTQFAYGLTSIEDSALVIAEQDFTATPHTTTQVTTKISTHSFPLRRTGAVPAPPVPDSRTISPTIYRPNSPNDTSHSSPGDPRRSVSGSAPLRVDKALPKLPNEAETPPSIKAVILDTPSAPSHALPSTPFPQKLQSHPFIPSPRLKKLQGTAALAHAAVGSGTPLSVPVNLNSMLSSLSVNPVHSNEPTSLGPMNASVTVPPSHPRPHSPLSLSTLPSPVPLPSISTRTSPLRRLKSFSKSTLAQNPSSNITPSPTSRTDEALPHTEPGRQQGMSIGLPLNTFAFGAQETSPVKTRSSEESPRERRKKRVIQDGSDVTTAGPSRGSRQRVQSDTGVSPPPLPDSSRRNSLWFFQRSPGNAPTPSNLNSSPPPLPRMPQTSQHRVIPGSPRPKTSPGHPESSIRPLSPIQPMSDYFGLPPQRVMSPLGIENFISFTSDIESPTVISDAKTKTSSEIRNDLDSPFTWPPPSPLRSSTSRGMTGTGIAQDLEDTPSGSSSLVDLASPRVPVQSSPSTMSSPRSPTMPCHGPQADVNAASIPDLDTLMAPSNRLLPGDNDAKGSVLSRPRRSNSTPRLSAAFYAVRRRSMSLFHNAASSTPVPKVPNISAGIPFPLPLTVNPPLNQISDPAAARLKPPPLLPSRSDQPIPLLRKLSQTFMPSSSTSPVLSVEQEMVHRRSSSSFGHISGLPPSVKPAVPEIVRDEESPESYVGRLMHAVSRGEIAGILAASNDLFHAQALHAYMTRFHFHSHPLDVALRKLLMDVGLPRETQQIDRVMEAFAARYQDCNAGLFANSDHPYILAFSLIMLHTDAFNPSNKSRMVKADYIKNARLPGIPSEVLDCYYDNITFAPFIFVEDPMDVDGQRSPASDLQSNPHTTQGRGTRGAPVGTGGSTMIRRQRIDPYFLIRQGLLDPLRADVESYIPWTNPYSYKSVTGQMSEKDMHRAFVLAPSIEVIEPVRRKSLPLLASAGAKVEVHSRSRRTLRITKVGLVSRKEDLDGGRRATSRKWRDWTLILTGSQLLFFKDVSVASAFMISYEDTGIRTVNLKPDELVSLQDAVALCDTACSKYPNAFRFVMPSGKQYLIKTSEANDMGQWMSLINYASAFKSSGIQLRDMAMTRKQAISAGTAAAVSLVKDIKRNPRLLLPTIRPQSDASPSVSLCSNDAEMPTSGDSPNESPVSFPGISGNTTHRMTVHGISGGVDLDTISTARGDGRLEDTFNQVKAELAFGSSIVDTSANVVRLSSPVSKGSIEHTTGAKSSSDQIPSRDGSHDSPQAPDPQGRDGRHSSSVIRSKIRDLDSRIATASLALDSDLRIARNLRVLTPFQRSTRERVQNAVGPVAKRVKELRLDIVRLRCQRDILAADLMADEEDWERTKCVALKAATKELRVRTMSTGFDSSSGSPVTHPLHSMRDDCDLATSSSVALSIWTTADRPQSSTSSFFTAVDDHSVRDRNSTLSMSDHIAVATPRSLVPPVALHPLSDTDVAIQVNDEPINASNAERGSPFPTPSDWTPPSRSSVSSTPIESPIIVQPSSTDPWSGVGTLADEEAEDWSKTRAAKRVSLVTLPPQIVSPSWLGTIRRDRVRSDGTLSFQSDNKDILPECRATSEGP